MADFVTLNSLRMDIAGCWEIRDPVALLEQGPFRGSDFVAQGEEGRTFRAKVRDAHSVMLPVLFFGDNDKDGVAHPDTYSGLRDNIEQAYTSWVEASQAATITCTVTYDDAATRTASVYCPQLRVSRHSGYRAIVFSGVLEVVIPSGKLS